jgi:hypothetical protein
VHQNIAANPVKYKKMNTPICRRLQDTLGSAPLSFKVFKKRVISMICCNDVHCVAYSFAVNVGTMLTKANKGELDDPLGGGLQADCQDWEIADCHYCPLVMNIEVTHSSLWHRGPQWDRHIHPD